MIKHGFKCTLLIVLVVCNGCLEKTSGPVAVGDGVEDGYVFREASSVAEVRTQIEKLPKDDIWWNVYGEDQAWNFKNLHRFLPTVNVYREGQVRFLENQPMPSIPNHKVSTPQGEMTFKEMIASDQSTTMGIVILHQGKIVFEYYPRQEPYEKPIYWSVTKVFVAAIIGIMEDRGQIDVGKQMGHYIPELKDSDFYHISVRNVLDMATGVACPEEYEDWGSCYYVYSKTIGDGFWDVDSPTNPYEMLGQLKPGFSSEQGTEFQYSGVNTFLLGWLAEKIAQMPFQDILTKEIWSKIGAEGDASIIAPRYGVPITHGGLLARLRDMARFGLLYTPSYNKVTPERIISQRMIKLLRDGGNPELWKKAFDEGSIKDDFSHSIYQWDQIYKNHDFFKGGWGGQGLLVNPDKDLVVAYTGYYKDSQGSEIELLPILRQLLKDVFPAP